MSTTKSLAEPKLLTPGVIASGAGVGVHLVQDEIHRRQMKPIGRAGTLRVFSKEQAETIVEAIRARQEARR